MTVTDATDTDTNLPPLTPRQIYAKNLRLGRQLAGMSQDRLAALIDAHNRNEISRYEHAHRLPIVERQEEIATDLGQSIAWFWERHDDQWARHGEVDL